MLENVILGIVATICTLWIGGLQYTVRKMEKQLEQTISKREVRELINDKLESHGVKLEEVKEDLTKIEAKLDRIVESLYK